MKMTRGDKERVRRLKLDQVLIVAAAIERGDIKIELTINGVYHVAL